jgi:hypothetical protein
MSDDGLEAIHREVMARIRRAIGAPSVSPGTTDADPLGYLRPTLREWWLMRGRGTRPTLILHCADCHTRLGEIVSDADDPDLAVAVLRRHYGDNQPVDFRDWSPGALAEQLDGAAGEAPRDPAGRSLIEHLWERQAQLDGATLRILPDGRRITRRYREAPDVVPLDLAHALCPEHGWIDPPPQLLRTVLAATSHGTQRKILLTRGIIG